MYKVAIGYFWFLVILNFFDCYFLFFFAIFRSLQEWSFPNINVLFIFHVHIS